MKKRSKHKSCRHLADIPCYCDSGNVHSVFEQRDLGSLKLLSRLVLERSPLLKYQPSPLEYVCTVVKLLKIVTSHMLSI